MEAGDKFRGKECRKCSLRRHSAVQQPLQRAASAIAAHYIRPRSTLASSITPSANGPTEHSHHHYTSSYYERETDKYPRESSLYKWQKQWLPQKPVGPMFYDANIGPTGYIVRFQLRLRSFGSPDKPGGLSIQPCKSEKEEPYIRHSSQGRSECLYLRIE